MKQRLFILLTPIVLVNLLLAPVQIMGQANAVDFYVAQKRAESDERIAKIYAIAIVSGGALVGAGVFLGLRASRKKKERQQKQDVGVLDSGHHLNSKVKSCFSQICSRATPTTAITTATTPTVSLRVREVMGCRGNRRVHCRSLWR